MGNQYFRFKQFLINQEKCAMKVGTDSVLLACFANPNQAKTALDIGTGTGILALMIAQQNPNLLVDAIEIDELAYQQAKDNFENAPFHNQLNIYFGSLQQFNTTKLYDLIITNPPYFIGKQNYTITDLQRAKARHDNDLPFEELILKTLDLLNKNGVFTLILPFAEAAIFKQLALNNGLFCSQSIFIKPKLAKPINRVILSFVRFETNELVNEFIVYNDDNMATEAYKNLTKDYYL